MIKKTRIAVNLIFFFNSINIDPDKWWSEEARSGLCKECRTTSHVYVKISFTSQHTVAASFYAGC